MFLLEIVKMYKSNQSIRATNSFLSLCQIFNKWLNKFSNLGRLVTKSVFIVFKSDSSYKVNPCFSIFTLLILFSGSS